MKSRSKNDKVEPIEQSVHVDCPPEDTFRLFTEGFGKWWPLALGSGPGKDEHKCEIEPWAGGRVVERSPAGLEREWGAVTIWSPPARLEFTWNPDGRTDDCQTVSVEFQSEADGTRVTLTHHGWQFAGVTVCIADSASSADVVQGLVVCRATTWKPVAIGRDSPASVKLAGPVGSGVRENAWRNVTRPTWAEVFLNSFAAFATEHKPVAV